MTENETKLEKVIAEDYKAVLHEARAMGCSNIKALYNIPIKNMELIVKALEEVQQYRELKEKLNGVDIELLVNHFIEKASEGEIQGYQRGRVLTNEDADKWDQYRAIGTPEELRILKENGAAMQRRREYEKIGIPKEFRAAREKQKEKKKYCWECGQKLDLG